MFNVWHVSLDCGVSGARAKVGNRKEKKPTRPVVMSQTQVESERDVTKLEAEPQRHAGDGGEAELSASTRKKKKKKRQRSAGVIAFNVYRSGETRRQLTMACSSILLGYFSDKENKGSHENRNSRILHSRKIMTNLKRKSGWGPISKILLLLKFSRGF